MQQQKWSPVINYETCTECGACVDKCTHDVYEPNTSKPNVVNPDGCIDNCKGCQALCPSDSIDYVGDIGEIGICSCNCNCL